MGFDGAPASLYRRSGPRQLRQEYILQQAGDALLIAGGRAARHAYGVIGLLRDHFGCRWYTRDVTKVPEMMTLRVDGLPDRQKPAFVNREPWYREVHDVDFAVFNRINPSMVPIPEEKGGRYVIYPFVHTFNQLVPPEEYFDAHPEYFSLVDGERQRVGDRVQLCPTNPEVLRIATEQVLQWICGTPEADLFSVDQNDGYGYCECDNCAALDEAEEHHSGTLLHFMYPNRGRVAERHPGVELRPWPMSLEIPPKHVLPRDNVTIRMCHYEYQAHAIGQCDDHEVFVERLEGWSAITDSITIWDYYTNFRHYLMPYPNFESVINHPRFYAERNCIGLFAQGNNVRPHGGGEFSALRTWVFAQLMWDPYQDGRALIGEFVENVYGPAAPHIAATSEAHEAVKPWTCAQHLRQPRSDGLPHLAFLDSADAHLRRRWMAQDDPRCSGAWAGPPAVHYATRFTRSARTT